MSLVSKREREAQEVYRARRDELDGLKGAVSRHLDRFAFREAPLTFDWKDASL